MSYVEEIEEIWGSNEVRDLSEVVKKLLILLSKAKSADETVPIELEVDIVLNANYSFGYGAQLHESKVLVELLHRLNNEDHNVSKANMYRLACTASSSLATILATDTFNSTKHAHVLFPWEQFDASTSKLDILSTMLDELLDILEPRGLSLWKLETISFVITYVTIIDVIKDGSELKDRCRSQIEPLFSSVPESDQRLLAKWRSEWIEKADYSRFVGLMITDMNLPPDSWTINATYITGQN